MALDAEAEGGGLAGPVGDDARVEVRVLALEVAGLEPGEGHADLEVQLLARLDGEGLGLVGGAEGGHGLEDVGGVDGAELGAEDALRPARGAELGAGEGLGHGAGDDFEADVLALPVAVEPEDEVVHALGLRLQKVDDSFFFGDPLHGRGEEGSGINLIPVLKRRRKVGTEDMTNDRGHLYVGWNTSEGSTECVHW